VKFKKLGFSAPLMFCLWL